ncbi:MAG: hypothetical protein HYS04_04705 [Acidobacteria bacterium]|nr:hypothetical protein [Acidobacteriota bacterium]
MAKTGRSPDPFGGVSAAAVRDFLKQASELPQWTLKDLQKLLVLDTATARTVARTLESFGYAEPIEGARGAYRNTAPGNLMAGVSRAGTITRETAASKLDEFLERVATVNEDDHYLFRVKRALLYGPYLIKGAKVKDIDLAVELEPKTRDRHQHEARLARRAEEAETAGKRFVSFKAKQAWGRAEVLEFLKSRSRALSLSGEVTDWVLRQPHKVVFED